MTLRVLSWNLFHGRDSPPDPELFTWRSRLLRVSERNATHAQVNRDLLAEFATVLDTAGWDVALLQEAPPRWAGPLGSRCDAEPHRVLTSRNSLAPLRSLLGRLNPDLIASGEGGSNLTLVRRASGRILDRRELELRSPGVAERRAMAFTRVRLRAAGAGEICVANLHASAGRIRRELAEEELRLAAERAVAWADGAPLILGGDLNVRPRDSRIYEELASRHRLTGPTGPAALDHVLVRGLETAEPASAWPPERREVAAGGLALRLSDHAPVTAAFRVEAQASRVAATATEE